MASATTPAPSTADPALTQDPIYAGAATGDDIRLRDVVDTLVRGRWIILATLLAVAVPVAVYTVLQPSRYHAYVLMIVNKRDSGLGDILSSNMAPWMTPERNLENELLVLRQSLPLADSAARRLMAIGRTPQSGTPLTILDEPEEGYTLTPLYVAARLQRYYVSAVMEGRDVDAIRVSAVSTDPEEAALIANVYAEEFVRRTRESSRSTSNASRTFLEEQVRQQAAELAAADAAVRNFMLGAGVAALDQETSSLVTQVAHLQAQRDEANVEAQMRRAAVVELERELDGIEPRLAQRIASGVDREIAGSQERIAQLEGRIEQIYLRNPALRAAEPPPAEVADLQRQVEVLRARVREQTERLLEESLAAGDGGPGDRGTGVQRALDLRRRLIDERILMNGRLAQRDVLTARIAEYEERLRVTPAHAIELARLQRNRHAIERLYLALQEKLAEARVAEEGELGYTEVIRPALVPPVPYAPNRPLNVALGVLLGLGLGIGLAFARRRLDRKVYRPDDLREAGYTVIGTVPDTTELIREDFKGADRVTVDGQSLDTRLVTLLNPMAAASESYRALRTNVQFSRPDVVVETILITSAKPAEGKSTTATNLAVVLAQAGRRVLLVDADLRKPSLHKKLGIGRAPGLVDVIFQDAPFDPEPFATFVDGLYVIPAGTTTPNPSELLGSRKMRERIAAFREGFDIVILDAPPVLAATDAVLLSTQADATLVVASAGSTDDHDLKHAMEELRGVGAKVIGVVLNRFNLSQAYGYKYKYAYRYGSLYGYGQEQRNAKWRLGRKSKRTPAA